MKPTPRKALLHLDRWRNAKNLHPHHAAIGPQAVLVVNETSDFYRIQAPAGGEVRLCRDRQVLFGVGTSLVPKAAITFV